MDKNKKKSCRNRQEKRPIYRIIGYVFITLIVLALIIKAGYESYINHLLQKQGICIKAVVYERKSVGGKGDILSKYQFKWKNITYYGESEHDTKTKGESWFYDNFISGDTITIVFLENDPDINRSNSQIKKDCECVNE